MTEMRLTLEDKFFYERKINIKDALLECKKMRFDIRETAIKLGLSVPDIRKLTTRYKIGIKDSSSNSLYKIAYKNISNHKNWKNRKLEKEKRKCLY